jgi:hypothetical protein
MTIMGIYFLMDEKNNSVVLKEARAGLKPNFNPWSPNL